MNETQKNEIVFLDYHLIRRENRIEDKWDFNNFFNLLHSFIRKRHITLENFLHNFSFALSN